MSDPLWVRKVPLYGLPGMGPWFRAKGPSVSVRGRVRVMCSGVAYLAGSRNRIMPSRLGVRVGVKGLVFSVSVSASD